MPIDITQYLREIGKAGYEKTIPLRRTNNKSLPGYLDIRERMGWHIKGEFPYKLLKEKRPSEDPAWFQWRKDTFTAITKGAMNEAISDAKSTFIASNFTIMGIHPDDAEFINSEVFGEEGNKSDFVSWMHERAFPQMLLDTHGYIVCMPTYPGTTKIPAKIDLQIVDAKQVLSKPNDNAFAWVSYEESSLKKDGRVIYVIDDNFVYRAEEKKAGGVNGSDLFSQTIIYKHETGNYLSQILGGIPDYRDGQVLYRSFFEPFCETGDDCLDEYSTYKVITSMMGFPIAERYQTECQYEGEHGSCSGGKISVPDPLLDGEFSLINCPRCHGTGYAPAIHPGHVIEKPRPHGPEDPNYDEIKYVTPPIEAIQESRTNWKELLEESRRAISIKDIYHAQSGAAKDADKESRERLRRTIAKRFFGVVMENTLRMIVQLRRPYDWQRWLPTVGVPTSFKLKDSDEMLDEVRKVAERPPSRGILARTISDYIATAYENDPVQAAKSRIEMMLAPLTTKTQEELQRLELSGAISARDVLFIENCWELIEEITHVQGTAMLDNDLAWWRKAVKDLFDERFPEPEMPPIIDPNIGG